MACQSPSGIYAITDSLGRQYIGSSHNIKKRWQKHKSRLRAGDHINRKLQNAWNKNGEEFFSFSIKIICGKDTLPIYEEIAFKAFCPHYNIWHTTSPGRRGKTISEETRARQSLAAKTSPRSIANMAALHSPEMMAKAARAFSESEKAQAHLARLHESQRGVKRSEESRARMRAAQAGKVFSPEHRAKITASRAGYRPTAETRAKMSEAQRNRSYTPEQLAEKGAKISAANKGVSMTQEARANMSIAKKGKPWSQARRKAQRSRNKIEGQGELF